MTNTIWNTCKHCGERWDSSGRYTSPANAARDRAWWKTEHESGKCLAETTED